MQESVLQITKIVLVHAYSITANSQWLPGVFSMQQNLCPRLPEHTVLMFSILHLPNAESGEAENNEYNLFLTKMWIEKEWEGRGRPAFLHSFIAKCLSLFWIKPTPSQPPIGALICLALVTSFYPKGLQLLLPHYEQNLSFTNLWRRLLAIGDVVGKSRFCTLSVWGASNNNKKIITANACI